jgi:hypothetical protein
VYRFIKGEHVNDFIRQKNSGREIRRGGFNAIAFRRLSGDHVIALRPRFSEREERLRVEMRGLPRE